MKKCICPNCGAPLEKDGICKYCYNDGNSEDFYSEIKATKQKNKIKELQKEIEKEHYEIDKLMKDNPSNGCLKLGLTISFIAIIIIIAILFFCRGDGYSYVIIGGIVVLSIVYGFCRSCDNSQDDNVKKLIKKHKRKIKILEEDIENIKKGNDY